MLGRTISKLATVVALAVPMTLVGSACGGSGQGNAKVVDVKAGSMPDGAEWRGVYFSPLYGNLHIVQEGSNLTGRWRTAAGEAWGEMHGEVDGDLFRYEWVEHKIGMVGPSATSSGKGYFRYVRPKNGVDPDEIVGEWGLNESNAGNEWKAVKQANMQPDPASVMPDEYETTGQGGGWDDTGTQAKPPPSGDEGLDEELDEPEDEPKGDQPDPEEEFDL